MRDYNSDNPGFSDDEVVLVERPAPKRDVLRDAMDQVNRDGIGRPWSVDEVANYAAARNILKFTDQDAALTQELPRAAIRYAMEYDGDFDYMLSMKSRAANGLSLAMVRGVLNCMLAQHRYLAKQAEQAAKPAPVPSAPAIPVLIVPQNGTYTIVRDGKHVTIKIEDSWIPADADTGTRVASILVGPDNTTDFASFAFVDSMGIHVWKQARQSGYRTLRISQQWIDALTYLVGGDVDTEAAGYEYAIRSGRCFVCGRKLTVPASIHRGMGPVCALRR